ncbi:A-kinase anchoring protein 7 isoform X2 [Varanus komodoensis]|uniref:A-kinase anchoring protein 7 isoform X2 n=1 Tax=Varanus komodoensis TaxID=61221 RepID=UPI001CF77A68|nr:A-kinase anchoring protein 7 isoform X2 [Varanus komodoensis]XP_044280492.1 A-kinase anchoring protein 7 isoform X2 [Varanus komodoensis]
MLPRLSLQLLLRTLRPIHSVPTAFPSLQISLCGRAPLAVGQRSGGSRTAMEALDRPSPEAESQKPGAEAESGGQGPPLPATSQLVQQTDGGETVEQKKKQRKKQRKESQCLDNSISCLMLEMPFAKADVEAEFSTTHTSKTYVTKKRKRTTGKESENDNQMKKKKKDQDHPNYFVSVPITNLKIMDGIQALQEAIIQKDNRLSKAMVRYGSLHITLLVMHLSSEAAIENAVGAFLESKGLIEELLQGKQLNLSFQGTDHFRNQVGFVSLTENAHTVTLLQIAEIMKKIFQEKGIFTGDDRAFKPHLTFMKLSKSPKLRKQGVKKIDATLFENFKNHYFGTEPMKRLDLCSMLKKKQPDGYYYCESSITIGKSHEADVIKEALHRELLPLLSKLSQIKVLLSSPEVRMKMYNELLEKGLVSSSIRESVSNPLVPL